MIIRLIQMVMVLVMNVMDSFQDGINDDRDNCPLVVNPDHGK